MISERLVFQFRDRFFERFMAVNEHETLPLWSSIKSFLMFFRFFLLLHVRKRIILVKSCFWIEISAQWGVWGKSKLDEKVSSSNSSRFWWKGMEEKDEKWFLNKTRLSDIYKFWKWKLINTSTAAWKSELQRTLRMASKRAVCVEGKSILKSKRDILNSSILKRRIN